MWSGTVASIPTGWVLCDGNNSTPNLVGQFVRGGDGDAPSPVAVGTSGGANAVTLTEDNLAEHTHSGNSGNQDTNHSHSGNTSNNNASHSHPTGNNSRNHSHRMNGMYIQTNRNWMSGPYRPGPNQFGNVNYSNSPQYYPNHGSGNVNANHTHPTGNQRANHYHPFSTGNQSASHSHDITIGNAGNATDVTITNPYYVLAYIMKS